MANGLEWASEKLVYCDFETQSAADIKEVGGRLYAEHPSTRILILVCAIDDIFHVWIPDHIQVSTSSWNPNRLWPYQLNPSHEVILHRGKECPNVITESTKHVPVVAHNAFMFDKIVWDKHIGTKVTWLDSLLLSRAIGRPGGLDAVSKSILGIGKDKASKLLPKLTKANISSLFGGYSYPIINNGDLFAFTTYAIADVELVRRLWKQFDNLTVEVNGIHVHNEVNNRGIKVDIPLLQTLSRLSEYSVRVAIDEIVTLTNGQLNEKAIRSPKQMHEWLDGYGIKVINDDGKPCLRKEVIQRLIDSPFMIEDNLTAIKEVPPTVIEVLKLRMKALRISDAKIKSALKRVSKDGRIRDLHSYHIAHTGRNSSQGLQVHNLPRPLEVFITKLFDGSTPLENILNELESLHSVNDNKIVFDRIKSMLPQSKPDDIPVTVNDICSTLIRPSITCEQGKSLILCDYSQIEARAIAWIADEKKLLKQFSEGKDVYKEFASNQMFKVPLDEVTKDMRQICKSAVLGLGYGMGSEKFRIYAASNRANLSKVGLSSEFVVNVFRDTFPRICGFKPDRDSNFRTGGVWQNLDRSVKDIVSRKQGIISVAKCRMYLEDNNLIIELPSGRKMFYPEPRIEDIIPAYCYMYNLPLVPKATVVFTSARGPKPIWGSFLSENISQGFCRDIMIEHQIELDNKGFNPIINVHDEIGCEVDTDIAIQSLESIVGIMSTVPDWADGFPLFCEGFITPRFTKEPFKGYKKYTTKHVRERIPYEMV